jgi:hypothetical protein
MADETRTIQKDFNRDLLRRDLTNSALPFESLDLAGFVRKNRFEGTPAPGPRVLTDDKVANTQDIAQPGEIRFVFTTALTGAEGAALDTGLANHVSTDRLGRQARIDQDLADLNSLETNWPNFDSFTDAQFKAFVKRLARFTIRRARQAAAF